MTHDEQTVALWKAHLLRATGDPPRLMHLYGGGSPGLQADFEMGGVCVRVTDDRGQCQIDISVDKGNEWHLVEDARDAISIEEGRLAGEQSLTVQHQMEILAEVRLAMRRMSPLEKGKFVVDIRARKRLRGEQFVARLNDIASRAKRGAGGS